MPEKPPETPKVVGIDTAAVSRWLADLRYWHALELCRLAIIAEGVMRRAMDEPQNRAAAGTPTVVRIDALVRNAREIADAAGIW